MKKKPKSFSELLAENFERHRGKLIEATKDMRTIPYKRLHFPIR